MHICAHLDGDGFICGAHGACRRLATCMQLAGTLSASTVHGLLVWSAEGPTKPAAYKLPLLQQHLSREAAGAGH